MNTDLEKRPSPETLQSIAPDLPSVLNPAEPVTKQDETAAVLEQQVQREREERRTERFFWVFALLMSVDIFHLPTMGWGAIPTLLLELVFLIGVARWFGIDWAVVLFQRIFDNYIKPPPKAGEDADQ